MVRENWYRDVWLFAITVLMLAATIIGINENRRRIAEIQQSRVQVCELQNARHDNSIRTLDELIAKLPPKQRKQAKGSRDANVILISALVPRQNCRMILLPPDTSP
jgi:hypothetical protein